MSEANSIYIDQWGIYNIGLEYFYITGYVIYYNKLIQLITKEQKSNDID